MSFIELGLIASSNAGCNILSYMERYNGVVTLALVLQIMNFQQ